MTPLSQKILNDFQTRKTFKQKSIFIALLQEHFPDMIVEECGFPKCRNLIVGDLEKAKVILCAHYDTCAQLPFPNFIMPKKPVLSILYSILLLIPIFLGVFLLNLLLSLFTDSYWVHYWLSMAGYLALLFLMIAGPANKHTANDNTSGVITLCELIQVLTPALRNKAAFIFFDHEETGLLGSSNFRSRHKQLAKEKLIINFDCVSDGDYIMVSVSKQANIEFETLLKSSFLPGMGKKILFTNAEKTYYPSDQVGFRKAVAVAALKRKLFADYCIDKIHTAKDTCFDKTNIKFLCERIRHLLECI